MGNTSINIIKGKEKIILSAPYSVLHMRENSIRPRETRTGTIGLTLPFGATNKNCVSTYIADHCQIPAIQLEINLKYNHLDIKNLNIIQI
ncbi:MAG: hypothetical protein V8R81_06535 [Clostridia bacterium]